MKIWPGRYNLDDVWDIARQPENDGKRFELLDGQLVEFSPAGLQHGLLAAEMCFHICDANKRASLGLAPTLVADAGAQLLTGKPRLPESLARPL